MAIPALLFAELFGRQIIHRLSVYGVSRGEKADATTNV